jgi:hypothetical protein
MGARIWFQDPKQAGDTRISSFSKFGSRVNAESTRTSVDVVIVLESLCSLLFGNETPQYIHHAINYEEAYSGKEHRANLRQWKHYNQAKSHIC